MTGTGEGTVPAPPIIRTASAPGGLVPKRPMSAITAESRGIGRMNVGSQRSLSKWKKNNFIYNCYRGKYFEDDVKRHSSKSRDSKRDRSRSSGRSRSRSSDKSRSKSASRSPSKEKENVEEQKEDVKEDVKEDNKEQPTQVENQPNITQQSQA